MTGSLQSPLLCLPLRNFAQRFPAERDLVVLQITRQRDRLGSGSRDEGRVQRGRLRGRQRLASVGASLRHLRERSGLAAGATEASKRSRSSTKENVPFITSAGVPARRREWRRFLEVNSIWLTLRVRTKAFASSPADTDASFSPLRSGSGYGSTEPEGLITRADLADPSVVPGPRA